MTSGQLLNRVRWIVVGSVALLFVLVVVLVFQIAIRLNSNSTVAALEREQEALQNQLINAERDISYFQSPEFIEDWAREHLGLGRPGQSIFTR